MQDKVDPVEVCGGGAGLTQVAVYFRKCVELIFFLLVYLFLTCKKGIYGIYGNIYERYG